MRVRSAVVAAAALSFLSIGALQATAASAAEAPTMASLAGGHCSLDGIAIDCGTGEPILVPERPSPRDPIGVVSPATHSATAVQGGERDVMSPLPPREYDPDADGRFPDLNPDNEYRSSTVLAVSAATGGATGGGFFDPSPLDPTDSLPGDKIIWCEDAATGTWYPCGYEN